MHKKETKAFPKMNKQKALINAGTKPGIGFINKNFLTNCKSI